MIACQRALFDIPDDVAYLNCAYMSPLVKACGPAAAEALARKVRPWTVTEKDFFTESEEVRGLLARMIGATAEDVAITPSASYGVSTAAANLPLGPGDRVMVLADQFPSAVYPWRTAAARTGAELVTVPRPGDGDWTKAIEAEAAGGATVICVPQCHWTDGSLIDLKAVSRLCRRIEAALVIDATQSLGVMPLDVAEVEADFIAAAGYKWLMGPYSFGYLYVAPKRQDGVPLEENWIGRKNSENFSGLIDYRDDYQPGARRFDVGERSNFMLTPLAKIGLTRLLDWGIEEIAAALGRMTEQLADRAAALGLTALPAHLRSPHILGLRFPDGPPRGLLEKLARNKVYVSLRGDSVRVSPHVYNNEQDLDKLIASLKAVM